MYISEDSHTDHGLSEEIYNYLLKRFSDRDGFFKEVVDLPRHLHAPCGLYGPSMGDEPIDPNEIFLISRSDDRAGLSPVIKRPHRNVSKVFVVAGPHQNPEKEINMSCMLYTCYGGTESPLEPWDKRIAHDATKVAESKAFWAPTGGHALAVPHGHAIVRVREKNWTAVYLRAQANEISFQLIDKATEPHPSGDEMKWAYVGCSGKQFHKLIEDISNDVPDLSVGRSS